jgi:alpha-L-rhamnosidase
VGYYREGSTQIFVQTMQALPLAFGLVPDDRRAGLQAKLVEDVTKTRAGHEMVGIAGSRWILPVLSQAAHEGVAGAADAAYTVASQTAYPSYGHWMRLGWTSLGEFWERSSRTRSHHMFGGIVQWFYEDLAGIQPLAPGYRQVAFKPTVPAGLDRAEASYQSVRGTVASSWRQTASTLTLEVMVPPTATGLVYVPASDRDAVVAPGGAAFVGKQGARLVYAIGSGKYRFSVAVTADTSR